MDKDSEAKRKIDLLEAQKRQLLATVQTLQNEKAEWMIEKTKLLEKMQTAKDKGHWVVCSVEVYTDVVFPFLKSALNLRTSYFEVIGGHTTNAESVRWFCRYPSPIKEFLMSGVEFRYNFVRNNSDPREILSSIATFTNGEIVKSAYFKVLVHSCKDEKCAILLEDKEKQTFVVFMLKNDIKFPIQPDQIVTINDFLWAVKYQPTHLMSPSSKFTIIFHSSTRVSATEFVIPEPLIETHSSLEDVTTRHRNVCLRFVRTECNVTKYEKTVRSHIFTTSDERKVEVTFYNFHKNQSEELKENELYTILHTFYNGVREQDSKYCDARLLATVFTQFVPVSETLPA